MNLASDAEDYRERKNDPLHGLVARKLLSDGQWHVYEAVMATLMPYVDEEQALRRRKPVDSLTHEQRVYAGRRKILNGLLQAAVRYETGVVGGVRSIRLKPEEMDALRTRPEPESTALVPTFGEDLETWRRTGNESLWRLRARQLLADGEFHDFDVIVNELAKMVPPGVAVRAVERVRKNSARNQARRHPGTGKYGALEGRVQQKSQSQLVLQGQSLVIREMVYATGAPFIIEPRGRPLPGVKRRIKLRPTYMGNRSNHPKRPS